MGKVTRIEYGVHSHYFAVDKWTSKQWDGAVGDAVSSFQKILNFEGDKVLLSEEMMYTSLLSIELGHLYTVLIKFLSGTIVWRQEVRACQTFIALRWMQVFLKNHW